jgi:hypothetical protein
VPGSIVYDRTKTVVRRHVAPGKAVPLHPEAVAFAGHYDFTVDVLAAYRPTGKGRVERQVRIVRDHVLAGRSFASLDELDNAFLGWVPVRRRTTHRTHGEVIGVRARRDHAALHPIPARPYLVADRHLRHVGKDCLVAFEANLYSVPAARVFPRQLVEVRVSSATVSLHAIVPDEHGITLLAVHPRAVGRGAKVVDPDHWNGLPDGHTRATTTSGETDPADELVSARRRREEPAGALRFLLARVDAAEVKVGHRPLSVYDQITGTGPFT